MPAFSVSRSIHIEKPIEEVYEAVRDLKTWWEWSPWLITDPECKLSFSEDGKSYEWNGEICGSGSLTITSENRPKELSYDLQFLKPWRSQADVKFSLETKGNGTEATWSLDSKLPFLMFFLKNMMTTMLGMDYDRGLKMLKDKLELGYVPTRLDIDTGQVGPIHVIGVRTSCRIDEIGTSMEADMAKLGNVLETMDARPVGPPLSIYHKWAPIKGECEYTIGAPMPEGTKAPHDLVEISIPAIQSYQVTHTGAYRHLGNAWSAGIGHCRGKQYTADKTVHPFEIYANDPEETDDKDLVTVVHFPMK